MIKNYKINSVAIYQLLEELADRVKRKQLSKLDYGKWKILSNLAKKADETIYFDYEVECNGPTTTRTFWFGDSHIVLYSTIPVEKFVGQGLAMFIESAEVVAHKENTIGNWVSGMKGANGSSVPIASCNTALNNLANSITCFSNNVAQTLHQELTKTLSNISIEQTDYNKVNKLKINEREENNMFKNFKFGPVENPNVKISPYGIAVQNNSGTYVSYNKDTEEVVDVDILNFKCNNMLYMMPSAIADIKDGDVIIHNRVPMIVVGVDEIDRSRLIAVDVSSGEEKVILPTKSPFGFNFVTKIVSILDMMPTSTEANENNPFGNLLPFMIMGDNKDINPLMFMALSNGSDFTSNPMMLYALAASGKDNDNLLPLMLMGMNMKK